MKLQTVDPAVLPNRCTYRGSPGRQCRLPIFDPQSGLCANHHTDLKQNERADVAGTSSAMLKKSKPPKESTIPCAACTGWPPKTASPRRAKVLAYICGLLLSTLPLIAEERRAGITWVPNPPEPDPTKKPS